MAKRKKAGLIRKDAIPVNVYNEGLVVYLYDEANSSRLKDLLRKHRLKQDFFNNLQSKAFRRAVAREFLCLAYTLEQDDPISIEVGVGKPLTKSELQVARWHEPQQARLSLPSGRLRIDTPNTMPLDPDPPLDQGGIVKVKPGDYLLTLYRIDWDEMTHAGIRAKMPEQFILLTPFSASSKSKATPGPILDFPLSEDTSWIHDFRVEGKNCKCRLYFYGYWEGFWLNLDRPAIKTLGLQPGNRLKIETERLKFDALYLDRLNAEDYIVFLGKKRLKQLTDKFKEFAFATWKQSEGRLMLDCVRLKGTQAVSERHQDHWINAKLSVLPETWELPELQSFASTVPAGKNAVKSSFVMITSQSAVLNIKKSDLRAWNLSQGDQLSLTCNGETRTLVFCDHEKKSRWFHFITGKLGAMYYSTIERVMQLGGKIFAKKGTLLKRDLPVQWLPSHERLPAIAYFDIFTKGEPLLRIQPITMDCNTVPASVWNREFRITPGTIFLLRKRSS